MLFTLNKYSSYRKILLSLVALLLVTLISVFGIVCYSIIKVNEEAHASIEAHVAAIVEDKLNNLAVLSKDYAYWDDTIENAYFSTNLNWIDENIGAYLTDTFKITDSFIINGLDEAVISLKAGEVNESLYSTINKQSLKRLIDKARESGTPPVPVSGIMIIDNIPALVGVSVLAPEDDTSLPSPRPLLVLAQRLDSNYLASISEQYRLKNLYFNSEGKVKEVESSFKILNPLNQNLGKLSWKAENPGDLVLSKIQIPLLFLLVIISIITAYIIFVSRATAHHLEKANKDLAYNANHDALTGLLNRRLFDELFLQTINLVKRNKIFSALLCIDLDHFKGINDTYGHKAGDQLLFEVAARLKNSVRESDVIARMGGDEFAIILQSSKSFVDIEATVQKIIMSITQPILISDNKVPVGASIGVAMIPADGTDPDTLMTKADLALYKCKEHGRNTFRFYSDLNRKKEGCLK